MYNIEKIISNANEYVEQLEISSAASDALVYPLWRLFGTFWYNWMYVDM